MQSRKWKPSGSALNLLMQLFCLATLPLFQPVTVQTAAGMRDGIPCPHCKGGGRVADAGWQLDGDWPGDCREHAYEDDNKDCVVVASLV